VAEREIAIAGTAEGARKALETKRRKYGEDSPSKWGRAGGIARNNSPLRHSPFKDRDFARKMGKKSAELRWGKAQTPKAEVNKPAAE
jgi:hypothetical protein